MASDYTINSEFYNNGQYKPLDLVKNPTIEEFKTNGFDDLQYLFKEYNSKSIELKGNNLEEGNLFSLKLNNDFEKIEVINVTKKKNLIPIMTSNTSPIGECKANSEWVDRYAYLAFDNDLSTIWTNSTGQAWILYTFNEPTLINEISITHKFDVSYLYWRNIDVYGDGVLLGNITNNDTIKNYSKAEENITFLKKINNFKKYKTYKLVFDTTNYTYISKIEMYCNNYKFLIENNNKLYTIQKDKIIKLEDNKASKENFICNGFDDYSLITKDILLTTFNSLDNTNVKIYIDDIEKKNMNIDYDIKPFKPINKFKEINDGKFDIVIKEIE